MACGIADDIASRIATTSYESQLRDVPPAFGRALETELPDGDDALLELLSYVALSATKAGVAVEEPLCRINYWHEGAYRRSHHGSARRRFHTRQGRLPEP
jgi:hypothetical protein